MAHHPAALRLTPPPSPSLPSWAVGTTISGLIARTIWKVHLAPGLATFRGLYSTPVNYMMAASIVVYFPAVPSSLPSSTLGITLSNLHG